ncbi:MAG: winged helix-turn-helix transcriptional regulator [Gammaproteobacteria bacterium]|nr:winged helix-turn-helix transcriptional regulator [Gammaproteobacteria bacterium]
MSMRPKVGEQHTLEILEAIEARRDVTQRRLADQLGVALGLTNSYLRRCVRQGLVKIQQAPANRYFYYLTPQGMAEKSRLAVAYLRSSLGYYHRAGESIGACFAHCQAQGWRRLVLAGMSEIAEIASIRAHDFHIEVLGTIDLGSKVDVFLGRPVWTTTGAAPSCDAVVFTALAEPIALHSALLAHYAPDRVLVPEILRSVLDTPQPHTA